MPPILMISAIVAATSAPTESPTPTEAPVPAASASPSATASAEEEKCGDWLVWLLGSMSDVACQELHDDVERGRGTNNRLNFITAGEYQKEIKQIRDFEPPEIKLRKARLLQLRGRIEDFYVECNRDFGDNSNKLSLESCFEVWHMSQGKDEKGETFLASLPRCPAKWEDTTPGKRKSEGSVTIRWSFRKGIRGWILDRIQREKKTRNVLAMYHIGARYEIRGKIKTMKINGESLFPEGGKRPALQCTYNADKKYISGSSSIAAGSVDYRATAPQGSWRKHRKADVMPYDVAWYLDVTRHSGVEERKRYAEFRPSAQAR